MNTYKWISGNPVPNTTTYRTRPRPTLLGQTALRIQFRFQTVWVVLNADGSIDGCDDAIATACLIMPDGSLLRAVGYEDYRMCRRIDGDIENETWIKAMMEREIDRICQYIL